MTINNENRKPLVSVIINNYNYARFLGAAIESALNQTYQNIEVIVVDDGSTDDSKTVIESYGRQIKAIYKENGGQASAMNAGFAAANGELIYFLDSDDLAAPDCLEQVVETYLAAENPVALLNFRLQLMDGDGNLLDQFAPVIGVNLPSRAASEQVRRKGTFRHQPTSANVFTKKSLDKIMPIPEADFRICAETYLCYYAPLFGEIEAVERVLGFYRVHQNNNYHQPDKIYNAKAIAEYVKKQEIFYAGIEKSRRRLSETMNLPIGGNSALLHLIFKSANRRLSKTADDPKKMLGNLTLAAESLREFRQNGASFSRKRQAAAMLYLSTLAFLPKKMVSPLVSMTFIRSPKSLDFLLKKSRK